LITARKDFPANDLNEFIRYVKAHAGKVNPAHAGMGSITHTTCLLLHTLLGVQPTFVPFSGAAPAMNALLGGQVDYMCNAIPDSVPHVQGGTAKVYAISTAERSPTLPNVPTSKEAGLPGFNASAWNALFAPKGTPKAALDMLTDALDKALDDEKVRNRLLDLGCDIPAIKARPTIACCPGHKRDRALDADHQGSKHQSRIVRGVGVIFHSAPFGEWGQ
jgi:tripartite-type tricarboxylate transporter receptor subunit TctC